MYRKPYESVKKCHFQYRFAWCITSANHAMLGMRNMKFLVRYYTLTALLWSEHNISAVLRLFTYSLSIFCWLKLLTVIAVNIQTWKSKHYISDENLVISVSSSILSLCFVSVSFFFLMNEVHFCVNTSRDSKLEDTSLDF